MLIVALLIVLAAVSGVLGAVIHGLVWLFALTALFLIAAFFVGRTSSRA